MPPGVVLVPDAGSPTAVAARGSITDMEIDEHITALDEDGSLLADAAVAASLEADVPGCPGWQVRDLVRDRDSPL